MANAKVVGATLKIAALGCMASVAIAAAPAQASVFGFSKSALKSQASKRIDAELERRGVSVQADVRSSSAAEPASGVWVASGDMNGDGRSDQARRGKLEQNGTTVATAGDVQAPGNGQQAALLLPAVQKAHEPVQPQRAKLEQNGTTVAASGDVQAPNTTEGPHLLLPAVQKAHDPAQPQRAKLKQNGTTVATASEIAASSRD